VHQIDIFKSGIKVSPEPILIHVSDPNLVKVENLQRESRVEQIFSFNIDASCAGEGFIRVNIRGMLFLASFFYKLLCSHLVLNHYQYTLN
jgi:hypothetical protein